MFDVSLHEEFLVDLSLSAVLLRDPPGALADLVGIASPIAVDSRSESPGVDCPVCCVGLAAAVEAACSTPFAPLAAADAEFAAGLQFTTAGTSLHGDMVYPFCA